MILITLILHVDFQSWRLVLLMLSMIPLAMLGGVLGVYVGGGIVSLGSLVGFVTVIGIAARNAIMLIAHYDHLLLEEGKLKKEDVPWETDGFKPPTRDFIDGMAYDGHKPNAYIDGFAIGLKGQQKVEGGNVTGK
jgi:hypothetical protein